MSHGFRGRRRASAQIRLVLIGAALAGASGCAEDEELRRDLYASREECLADWGERPDDCEPAPEQGSSHNGRTRQSWYYGPVYPASVSRATRAIRSDPVAPGGRAVGVTRGGFGRGGVSSSGG
jgi:uncharacterized protein YgiB involved in biofilm formation